MNQEFSASITIYLLRRTTRCDAFLVRIGCRRRRFVRCALFAAATRFHLIDGADAAVDDVDTDTCRSSLKPFSTLASAATNTVAVVFVYADAPSCCMSITIN